MSIISHFIDMLGVYVDSFDNSVNQVAIPDALLRTVARRAMGAAKCTAALQSRHNPQGAEWPREWLIAIEFPGFAEANKNKGI